MKVAIVLVGLVVVGVAAYFLVLRPRQQAEAGASGPPVLPGDDNWKNAAVTGIDDFVKRTNWSGGGWYIHNQTVKRFDDATAKVGQTAQAWQNKAVEVAKDVKSAPAQVWSTVKSWF